MIGVLFSVIACSEEEESLFRGTQVERLMSGGESALWTPLSIISEGNQMLMSCEDSIHLLIREDISDSIQVFQLIPICTPSALSFDTLAVGKAKASIEDDVFTDSILFDDGNFWLIKEVFSKSLLFESDGFHYEYVR